MKNRCLYLLLLILLLSLKFSSSEATTYTVSGSGWANTGAGTVGDLQYCINQANADASAGPHRIVFATGVIGPISWGSSSFAIGNNTQQIIIDGETATGWSCGNPTVIIQYSGAWAQNLLTLQKTGVVLKSLIIQGFSPRLTAGTNEIYGCWFNLDASGAAGSTICDAMGATFMYISGGSNHIIGSNDCNRNIFGMKGEMLSQAFLSITGGNGTTLNGNYFGTSTTGLALVSDYTAGTGIIKLDGSVSNLTISNNVIASAGGGLGRGIVSTTNVDVTGLTISGNKIGLNSAGNVSAGFGNANGAINLIGAVKGSNITISDNDIGSNGIGGSADFHSSGIEITSAFSNVTISGNYIGVTRAYANAGNAFAGITVTTAITALSLTNNVIGFNGQNSLNYSHGWEIESSTGITVTGNYIGVSPTGVNIGNANSGMVFSSCSNVSITNNYICNNQGKRANIANGGIVTAGGSDFTIQNNYIGYTPIGTSGGQQNIGGNADGGSGIYMDGGTVRARIGGLGANTQNIVAYSAANGIELKSSSTDFIEMRWNSIFCNTEKGINLNGAANANLATPTITAPGTLPVSISGTKPANTHLDVFGTQLCSSSCSATPQGQKYKGEATTYPGGTAGTTWTFAPGGSIYDDLTGLATGVTGTSLCTATGIATCRTSEFSTCQNNTLPVSFIGVEAEYTTATSVTVSWQTATEINNSYYVIMRSSDGINFTPIATTEGKGTTAEISNYTFVDPMPFSENTYYKIKQVDIDGAAGYSSIVLATTSNNNSIKIYPNPNNGNFTLTLMKGKCDVSISSVIGQIVYSNSFDNAFAAEKEIETFLSKGTYILIVNSTEKQFVTRIVIE